ncbi:unnamed protein product [Discosporangium mesarthrocarpum]
MTACGSCGHITLSLLCRPGFFSLGRAPRQGVGGARCFVCVCVCFRSRGVPSLGCRVSLHGPIQGCLLGGTAMGVQCVSVKGRGRHGRGEEDSCWPVKRWVLLLSFFLILCIQDCDS